MSSGVAGNECHLHVLPRTSGDGYKVLVTSHPATRAELDETASRIRASLTAGASLTGGT